jgi:hypothetical protein
MQFRCGTLFCESDNKFIGLLVLTPTTKWFVIAALSGVVTYYCEWMEVVRPGNCNQGLIFAVARMYVVPVLIVGFLGYFCPSRPIICWLCYMLPSWIVRSVQLLASSAEGSNLAPPLLAVDVGHLLLTGVIAWGVAKARRSASDHA